MSHRLREVLPPIHAAASAIEHAFLTAGQGLNDGLGTFTTLKGSLAALGAELDEGASATASASLTRLSQAFAALGERLPADAATLCELVTGNHVITTRFTGLADSMRTMIIVSRSARIEAVAFDNENLGLEDFTRAIGRQIEDVQRDIKGCAEEHNKLTALLGEAARTQTSFANSFHGRLMALAGDLSQASDAVKQRRDEGRAVMKEAADRAVRITQAAGMAMVSLQVGDATRQRLEHVATGVKAADDLAGRDPDMAALLCRIQHGQLTDAVHAFGQEARDILQALDVVANETRDLVTQGATTYGEGEGADGTESFIAGFRQRFTTALRFVEACEATRQQVEAAIIELRSMLERLSTTIATLGATSRNLVLVGMNVGLKANRLGPEGRSLVVVAEELERLAGEIATQAQDLLPAFKRVQDASWRFQRQSDLEGTPGSLDEEFRAFMDELAQGEGKVAGLLRALGDTGRGFERDLAGARQAFELLVRMDDDLLDAAELLSSVAHDTGDPAGMAAAADQADALLMPIYTMVREREIHAAAIAEAGETPQQAQSLAA